MVSSTLMQRRKVDLPEPDGPTTTTTSPASISSVMPSSTVESPNFLVTLWNSTMLIVCASFFPASAGPGPSSR
ncbi:Uncharacterised protein [Bordetella pertussis]|nr:Uncharacterised protein [Bordetella pertussis]